MAKTVYLQTPISEESIRNLEVDDIVYLSGDAISMLYADHYTKLLDMLEQGEPLPMDLEGGAIYHTGTIYRRKPQGGYDMRALGATTSSKFNAQTPEFIGKMGIRAVIGKGGMDSHTLESMKTHGCVYLAIVGGCSAIYTPAAQLVDEYWPELMPADNQRLRFKLERFGPLYVAMDASGNSLYEQCAQNAQNHLQEIYQKLHIGEES